jgi:hypothetical protein
MLLPSHSLLLVQVSYQYQISRKSAEQLSSWYMQERQTDVSRKLRPIYVLFLH